MIGQVQKPTGNEENVTEYPTIWLQCAGCTGCSVSVLNSVSPTIKNLIVDEVIPGKQVNLRFHPTIMAGTGELALSVLRETQRHRKGEYLLVVEGAIPTADGGIYGAIGEEDGKPVTLLWRVLSLGRDAMAVIALGTCAAFGGIPSGAPNPTGCRGVKEIFEANDVSTPVVNIPGCPPHPDWFVGTVAGILLSGLPGAEELDEFGRPKAFFGSSIHENCPRRAWYDEGKFAKRLGEPGCMYDMGCKGPITYADCPLRRWNGGVNWCIGNNSPCIGCTEPGFPDVMSPFYSKMGEYPPKEKTEWVE